MRHGHVIPNENGLLARCGGPGICSTCRAEVGALTPTQRDIYERQEAERRRTHAARLKAAEEADTALLEGKGE